MKKIFKIISAVMLTFFVFLNNVKAYTFEVSATSYSVTVGNTVTLNIKVSDAAGKFNISSSDSSIVSVSSSSEWLDNSSASITLKANKAGTAIIYVAANDVTTYGGDNVNITKQVKITVNPKPTVNSNSGGNNGGTTITPRAKSSNNFLTSLTIDNLKLNEDFDKEKLEYTLTIPAETETIKINAQSADSNSKVSGTGEVKVSTGLNTLEIIVEAENGSKRTYVIKATVEELTPIIVKIASKEYTVIRKRSELPTISEYNVEKDITIKDNIIQGYYNEKLGYDLVGLKDDTGKINYYIYKNNKYTLYKEHTFGGTTLQILDKDIKGFKQVEFTYDNDKIPSYQEVKMDLIKNTYALDNNDITGNQFYLFYAKNLETGKENIYQYDAEEKTVQRYNTEVLDMYKKNSNTYYQYLLISLIIVIVLFILLIALSFKKNKSKKKSLKKMLDEEL